MIAAHKRHARDLVCAECTEKGFSPQYYKEYQCDECRKFYGSLKFNRFQLYNFKRQRSLPLECVDCRNNVNNLKCSACDVSFKCSACNASINKNYWTAAERKHLSRTRLVCKPCRQKGYNPDDVKTYNCESCGTQGGWKLFDAVVMKNFKFRGGKKPLCKACVMQYKKRIKRSRLQ